MRRVGPGARAARPQSLARARRSAGRAYGLRRGVDGARVSSSAGRGSSACSGSVRKGRGARAAALARVPGAKTFRDERDTIGAVDRQDHFAFSGSASPRRSRRVRPIPAYVGPPGAATYRIWRRLGDPWFCLSPGNEEKRADLSVAFPRSGGYHMPPRGRQVSDAAIGAAEAEPRAPAFLRDPFRAAPVPRERQPHHARNHGPRACRGH